MVRMARLDLSKEADRWTRRHPLHDAASRVFAWLASRRLIRQRPGEVFNIHRHTLRLPSLPQSFKPLTITHVSDFHVGHVFTPDHLPAIVETINDLGSDMIAITGDLVDHSNYYLWSVLAAIRDLKAPLGVYSVLGNHDYIDSGPEIAHAFHMADLKLLMNQHELIEHHGHRLAIAGIDWATSDANLNRLVEHTCQPIHGEAIRILLAHHPHALDAAVHHGVNLVLSGHTHGGQVLLRKSQPHHRRSLGLGNMAFRYPQGHYVQGNTHLFVTTGLGSALPVRIGCPAEISVLEIRPV